MGSHRHDPRVHRPAAPESRARVLAIQAHRPLAIDGNPTAIGRAYQRLPRLSPEWYDIYGPLRAYVENAFSTITTLNGANLGERAHHITGLPGTALWAACGLALHNHHRLTRWLRTEEVRQALNPEVLRELDEDPMYGGRVMLEGRYLILFPEE